MYRHVNRHIGLLLDQLRRDDHVKKYDNLMHEFAKLCAPMDERFRRNYVWFWKLRRVETWRERYFTLLQNIGNQARLDARETLRYVCQETLGGLRGGQSLEFSFATKLVHMVDPRSPICDGNVRAFYFLPDANGGGDIETRIDCRLRVYDALVNEYHRILENHLLDESIVRFRKELNPETFTDIKIIDSLIWAFVTWAGRGPAFVNGELQYE
jgi:hypothetical protein